MRCCGEVKFAKVASKGSSAPVFMLYKRREREMEGGKGREGGRERVNIKERESRREREICVYKQISLFFQEW